MDGVLVTLGDDGETVVFAGTGIKLGHIKDEEVRQVLRQLRYDQMSGRLHDYIYQIVEDPQCCPQCGGTDFYRQQDLAEMDYGFCMNCRITAHIIKSTGQWVTYPARKPYRRVINRLFGEEVSWNMRK